MHGAPAVPAGDPGVGPVPHQELGHVGAALPALLGHHLQGGQAVRGVLVQVYKLGVDFKKLFQFGLFSKNYEVQEVGLQVGVPLHCVGDDRGDGEGGDRAQGGQHGLVYGAYIARLFRALFTV